MKCCFSFQKAYTEYYISSFLSQLVFSFLYIGRHEPLSSGGSFKDRIHFSEEYFHFLHSGLKWFQLQRSLSTVYSSCFLAFSLLSLNSLDQSALNRLALLYHELSALEPLSLKTLHCVLYICKLREHSAFGSWRLRTVIMILLGILV